MAWGQVYKVKIIAPNIHFVVNMKSPGTESESAERSTLLRRGVCSQNL